MDDKAKYFGYGIFGGFLIIFIIIILFSVIGSTGLFGSTSVAVIPFMVKYPMETMVLIK